VAATERHPREPDRRSVIRESDIGDPGSRGFVHNRIAKHDFPIGSGPSIVRDARQEVLGSRGSGNRGFRGHRMLACWSRDPRYPDRSFEPSIDEDAWREIPESRSSEYRDFQSRETLAQWNRDMRFPDTIRAVHLWDRWQPSRTIGVWSHRKIRNRRIGDFVDTKSQHFEIAKSKIPMSGAN
jgi:hypothetical protein